MLERRMRKHHGRQLQSLCVREWHVQWLVHDERRLRCTGQMLDQLDLLHTL
jgi:hypothetical protein